MKTVDEIFPIDITASIGPSGTIRRVFQNRDYFASRGHKVTVFASYPVNNTKIKTNLSIHLSFIRLFLGSFMHVEPELVKLYR